MSSSRIAQASRDRSMLTKDKDRALGWLLQVIYESRQSPALASNHEQPARTRLGWSRSTNEYRGSVLTKDGLDIQDGTGERCSGDEHKAAGACARTWVQPCILKNLSGSARRPLSNTPSDLFRPLTPAVVQGSPVPFTTRPDVPKTPPLSRVLRTLQDFDRQLTDSGGREHNTTLIRRARKEIATSPHYCKEVATSARCRKGIPTSPRRCLSVNDELRRGRSRLREANARSLTLLRLVRRSASQKARRDGDL
ncbi:hypothetical protein DFH08DRAFT_819734 [Mycena albidolilacea]|uniref:Uncharacterized protein n=1 Tax=Mycena albidolilacea TaxID=1033008 RepID=A0AAD6ZDY5_9AGAR|nr:hypothetical protein DFH08DRAFT_819734 [Mycena albidolilacea]